MNYYVRYINGQVEEVIDVVAITIGSPLIANGYYRDTPPPVVGAAAAFFGLGDAATISGGVNITASAGVTDSLIGGSSIDQDDRYAHVDLRFVFSPIACVFFTTENFPATEPTGSSFPMARPVTNFAVVEADCLFKWDEIKGWTNTAPPGFPVTVGAALSAEQMDIKLASVARRETVRRERLMALAAQMPSDGLKLPVAP